MALGTSHGRIAFGCFCGVLQVSWNHDSVFGELQLQAWSLQMVHCLAEHNGGILQAHSINDKGIYTDLEQSPPSAPTEAKEEASDPSAPCFASMLAPHHFAWLSLHVPSSV